MLNPGRGQGWLSAGMVVRAVIFSLSRAVVADESKVSDLLPRAGSPIAVYGDYAAAARLDADAEETSEAKMSLLRAGAGVVVPLSVSPNRVFALLPRYEYTLLDFDSLAAVDRKSLHRIDLPLVARLTLDDTWALMLHAGVTVGTDFEDPDVQALQPSASGLAAWKLSSSTAFVFGAGVSRRFLELLPYPLLGVVYRPPASRWGLDILLPGYARVTFDVSGRFALVGLAQLQGQVWQVQTGPALSPTGEDHFLLKLQELRSSLGLKVRLAAPLLARLDAGMVAVRTLELRLDDNDPSEATLSPAPFVGLRLIVESGAR